MTVRSCAAVLCWRKECWFNGESAGLWIEQHGLGPQPRCVVFWDGTLTVAEHSFQEPMPNSR